MQQSPSRLNHSLTFYKRLIRSTFSSKIRRQPSEWGWNQFASILAFRTERVNRVSLTLAKRELDNAYLQAEADFINGKIPT